MGIVQGSPEQLYLQAVAANAALRDQNNALAAALAEIPALREDAIKLREKLADNRDLVIACRKVLGLSGLHPEQRLAEIRKIFGVSY